jgi:thioredoxin reductase (NADPH)
MAGTYDCLIVGGGIAGLQAAIQLGRYERKVLVIDKGYGRSTLCRSYHNILGWPDGVSGMELRERGRFHASQLGVEFVGDEVIKAEKKGERFELSVKNNVITYEGKSILFATGVMDRFPDIPGLVSCLGLSVYICPDCDGYETKGRRTAVMGAGNSGANMAIVLKYWTDDIVYINHERKEISEPLRGQLLEKGIECIAEAVEEVLTESDGIIRGVKLAEGREITAKRGFISFGGNEVKTSVAHQLGVERMENGHIITDPRTKMTSVPNVWAAGDVGVHSEQVSVAMGEGSMSAIWMHKTLLKQEKENKQPIGSTH